MSSCQRVCGTLFEKPWTRLTSSAACAQISGGKPVDVMGCAGLQAMEVDTQEAVDRFRAAVGGFRASDLGLGGVAEEVPARGALCPTLHTCG